MSIRLKTVVDALERPLFSEKSDPLRRKIAFLMPFVLVPTMLLIFYLYSLLFGDVLAWYFGLITYWFIWGLLFAFWMIGTSRLKELIRPQKPNIEVLLIVIIPFVIVSIGRFGFGITYEKQTIWSLFALVLTAFGNGFFEEILWRGVYLKEYPDRPWIRIGWSSMWFALWHFAPGTVSSNSAGIIILVIGAGFFGLYLSLLAKKTNSLWWCIVIHTLGALVMIA